MTITPVKEKGLVFLCFAVTAYLMMAIGWQRHGYFLTAILSNFHWLFKNTFFWQHFPHGFSTFRVLSPISYGPHFFPVLQLFYFLSFLFVAIFPGLHSRVFFKQYYTIPHSGYGSYWFRVNLLPTGERPFVLRLGELRLGKAICCTTVKPTTVHISQKLEGIDPFISIILIETPVPPDSAQGLALLFNLYLLEFGYIFRGPFYHPQAI